MDITPEKFIKELREGQTRPIYLFYGEENYSKEESIRKLKEHLSKIHKDRLLIKTITPEDEEASKVLAMLYTTPLFGGKTLVIIRDIENIPKSALKNYVDYSRKPNKTNTLALTTNRNDLKGFNQELLNAIIKNGCIVKFQKLEFSQLISWIKSLFKSEGIEISENAAFTLLDFVGNDRFMLSSEINKLCLFFQGKTLITSEDMSQYLSTIRHVDIFDLADSFLDRDYRQISKLLRRVFEKDKDSPLKLIGVLNKQLATLLEYKDAIKKRIPKDRIFNVLAKGKGVIMKKLEAREKLWEEHEIRALLGLLRELDKDIKQGGPSKLWLETLLFLV